MNKKLLAYAILPAFAFTLAGVGFASAHGTFGGRGFFFHKEISPEEAALHQTEMFASQAELLGLTVEQVKDAWAEGKNFKDLAEEAGISQEALQEKMEARHKTAMQEHMQALVDKGVITQEQADNRLEWMQSHTPEKGTMIHRGGGMGEHMLFFKDAREE